MTTLLWRFWFPLFQARQRTSRSPPWYRYPQRHPQREHSSSTRRPRPRSWQEAYSVCCVPA